MKNNLLLLLFIGLLFLISATGAVADESLFVQPFRAKVFAKPSLASEVLGQLDSGFQFVSTGKEGSWVKFSYKGKPGFIPAVQTLATPPLGKSVLNKGPEASHKLGARARNSSSTAVVAGMKGLTYEERARVPKSEMNDYDALDKVEAFKVTPEELQQFQLEGGKP